MMQLNQRLHPEMVRHIVGSAVCISCFSNKA